MADEERVVLTEEEKETLAKEWEDYVRREVNALLDIYLPDSIAGNVGIKYAHPVIESYEDGTKKINEDLAVGVNIHINFRFKGSVEIPKEDE